MDHLNLTVGDVERSMAFYGRWFGFASPRTSSDGTVFVDDGSGFDLAFHPGVAPRVGDAFHFGFRRPLLDVRTLKDELRRAGVQLLEDHDDADDVSLKCLDPDGSVVEVYWEPELGEVAAVDAPPG